MEEMTHVLVVVLAGCGGLRQDLETGTQTAEGMLQESGWPFRLGLPPLRQLHRCSALAAQV